jgi:tagatose-6-phosphate ketose/aldose isomerase
MELTAGNYSVMSESFLGLRHGPLSWLNHDSLVVGFLSNDPEKQKIEIGLLQELKAKNAAKSILAVLPRENNTVSKYSDYQLVLNIPETLDDVYRPPIDILFAQCLGLFASLRRHLRPDAPSADGKIQRVVSQITGA